MEVDAVQNCNYFSTFYINSCINISRTAPGTPNIPTKIAVYIFNPTWNAHIPPTRLISHISTPPNIELKTNFKIHLIGTMKIFPIINSRQMHVTKISRFIFIWLSPFLICCEIITILGCVNFHLKRGYISIYAPLPFK